MTSVGPLSLVDRVSSSPWWLCSLSGPWSTDEGYGFIRDGATREHSRGQLSRHNALRYLKVVDQVMTQVSIGLLSIGALCMCSRSAAAGRLRGPVLRGGARRGRFD